MVKRINGQLIFYYSCSKTKIIGYNFVRQDLAKKLWFSLLALVIGIFLLPIIVYSSDITSENLIKLTNQERINQGINALTANQLLTQAAYVKGNEIMNAQKFRHNLNDKKFSYWVREAGYNYSYIGENLAIDFITSEGIVKAWLNSSSHKKNLLNHQFSEIGIAVIESEFNGQNTTLVVQIFGAPADAVAYPIIMGMQNTNYQTPINLSINNENLLTHSLPSQTSYQTPVSEELIKVSSPAAKVTLLNKFFTQFNFLTPLLNYLIILSSLTLLILISYLYYFYFSRINKLFNNTI